MLFRPNFCANCGEKIERAAWGLLTSRRFCQLCESEFKGIDLIPRVLVAAGVLIGLLGFGTYLKSGTAEMPGSRVAAKQFVDQRPARQETAALSRETTPAAVPAAAIPTPATASNTAPARTAAPGAKVVTAAADAVYICGAETKKGTPCSRRVKGNVRCFQHTGMPAMLPADKLKVN